MDWIGIFSLLVALASLAAAVLIYYKSRRPKRLQYQIVVDQPLMTPTRYQAWDDLRVVFKEKRVEHPRLAVVRITNTGKQEVRAEDFAEPIKITAAAAATLVSPAIRLQTADGQPDRSLEPVAADEQSFTIPKVLLNEGDQLEARLLLDGGPGTVNVSGRIVGASLSRVVPPSNARAWGVQVASLFVGVAVAAGLVAGVSALQGLVVGPDVVPDVIGRDVDDATELVRDAKAEVVQIETNFLSLDPKGAVVETVPKAGEEIPEDGLVVLRISNGPPVGS